MKAWLQPLHSHLQPACWPLPATTSVSSFGNKMVLQTEFTQVNFLHTCDFLLSLLAMEFAGQSKFAWHASSRAGTEALPTWHPHLLCCYPNSQPAVILRKQLCTYNLKARFSWLATCHWAHMWVPNSCPPSDTSSEECLLTAISDS
jgi:hypothetical protein